jgi:tetratricopeptide (TPR) repeat protein
MMTFRIASRSLLFAALSLILLFEPVHSQPLKSSADSLDRAGDLFRTGDEQQGLDLYLDILEDYPENMEALWNTAVIYARMGYRQSDEEDQKEYYDKALDAAEKALEYHPDSGYAHYAMAVAKGRMTEVLDTDDKIESSNEIRNHLQNATEKLPQFAPVWHLYGVWHSDVANVSGIGRAAAGLFGEGLPDASNEKAEMYLKRAISLRSDNILFRLDLAKHYLKNDREDEAREVLANLLSLEPRMKGDENLLQEAQEMLQDLS